MGVVPMQPPNKSHEVVAAEVVEGRSCDQGEHHDSKHLPNSVMDNR